MSGGLKKLIINYGIDVKDELDVSPFEFAYTFKCREYIAKEYDSLDGNYKEKLQYYDTILISRAQEFYEYLKPIKILENSNVPIKCWWWHLDKVISGKIKVDIKNNEVNYNGKIIKLND